VGLLPLTESESYFQRRSRFGYGTVSRLSVCLSSGVFRNMKRGVPSVSGVGNMQRSGQR